MRKRVGPQYKSAYCMAVCPAGEDVIGPYLRDRRGYLATHLRPLRNRTEPVYVQSGTKAERVAARNPAKEVRYIDYKVGLASIDNTLRGLQHMFDGTRADLDGTSIRCLIEDDDTATHEYLLAVQASSLRLLEPPRRTPRADRYGPRPTVGLDGSARPCRRRQPRPSRRARRQRRRVRVRPSRVRTPLTGERSESVARQPRSRPPQRAAGPPCTALSPRTSRGDRAPQAVGSRGFPPSRSPARG